MVITNIETFQKEGRGFEGLWKNPAFVNHVISIVWDKGVVQKSIRDFCSVLNEILGTWMCFSIWSPSAETVPWLKLLHLEHLNCIELL